MALATGVVSPIASIFSSRSFSWSQASAKPSRANSRITNTRIFSEPEQEGRPLDSMLSRTNTTHSKSGTIQSHRTPFPQLEPEHSESGQVYASSSLTKTQNTPDALALHAAPMRSASTASKASTIQTSRSLFRDFDGTHYTNLAGDIAEEDEDNEVEDEGSSLLKPDDDVDDDDGHDSLPAHEIQASPEHHLSFITPDNHVSTNGQQEAHEDLLANNDNFERQPEEVYGYSRSQTWAVPPPHEHMVYYPAPVPMNLNLPKRLSRQSPALLQAQRRSQMFGALGPDARKSTILPSTEEPIPDGDEPGLHDTKRKTINLQKLPPQLRASMFFDQQPVHHDVPIHQGSAVLSLERMLDASAVTPAGVPARMSPQRARRARSAMFGSEDPELRNSRPHLLSSRHLSSDHASVFQRSRVGHNQIEPTLHERDGEATGEEITNQTPLGGADDLHRFHDDDYVHVPADHEPEEHLNHEEDDIAQTVDLHNEHQIAPPNTLLAELQLRKEELKSRNRTAASAYPTGMHSTLLELDAVAQIEKRRRGAKPTQLAWEGTEGPESRARREDDDVPLGLLFPARNALISNIGDRPLGLIEKRAIDDNEPLSRRRDRLLGIEPPQQPQHERNQSRGSVPVIGVFPTEPVEEEREETLAQRTRRLRSSRLLDEAIGLESGHHARAVSDDFASEMMSQLGVEANSNANNTTKAPEIEETLAQRRRRLQAEQQLSGEQGISGAQQHRPGLRTTMSLSNVLAAAPVGATGLSSASKSRFGQSGLLAASELELAARRLQLQDRNLRSTSHLGFGGPLLDAPLHNSQMSPGMHPVLGSYTGGVGGTTNRSQSRSPGPRQSLGTKGSAMSLGLTSHGGSMQTPSPYMQHGYGASSGAPTMSPFMQPAWGFTPTSQAHYWQQQMYPTLAPALNINTNISQGMGLDYSEVSLSPEQRTNIDRWRQSVMQ